MGDPSLVETAFCPGVIGKLCRLLTNYRQIGCLRIEAAGSCATVLLSNASPPPRGRGPLPGFPWCSCEVSSGGRDAWHNL